LTGDDVVTQSLRMNRNDMPCLPPAVLLLRDGQGWTLEDNPDEIRSQLDRIVGGWRPVAA
jgi:hypothetical protein